MLVLFSFFLFCISYFPSKTVYNLRRRGVRRKTPFSKNILWVRNLIRNSGQEIRFSNFSILESEGHSLKRFLGFFPWVHSKISMLDPRSFWPIKFEEQPWEMQLFGQTGTWRMYRLTEEGEDFPGQQKSMKSYRHDAAGAGHSEWSDAQWALRKPELTKLMELLDQAALENSWELGSFGR